MSVQSAHASPRARTLRTSAPTRHSVRLLVRWFNVLCLPMVAMAGLSYFHALSAPGNLSTVERSVEWLRGHHYGDTVSQVEAWYYSHHQPSQGGTLASLPEAVANGRLDSTPSTVSAGPTTATTPATAATADTGIVPFSTHPLPGEGQWQTFGDSVGGAPAMQVTYLRPDAVHGTVLAAVVRIDQRAASFKLVPGVQEPGNGTWSASQLTHTDTSRLLAAFNSGFRIDDANGGFALAGRRVGSLRDGAATAAITTDGRLHIGAWGRDLTAADQPAAVRQNLDLIVDGGQLVDGLDSNTGNRWGKTVGNALYVWRSGIGIDAEGRILYVASDGLTVKSLAALLQRAGAVRAMELDINHSWVTFNSFHHSTGSTPIGSKLLKGMKKPADRYLTVDARDYFAVEARSPIGAA